MIRAVKPEDAGTIASIYNEYVTGTSVTFETKPLTVEEMRERIAQISRQFPYLVYEEEGEVAGFCYAHLWKERAAFAPTLETTVYLSPLHTGQGLGRELMLRLIEACRQQGYHALIACITEGNERSCALHVALGFRKVSHFSQVGWKFGQWWGIVDYELLLQKPEEKPAPQQY